jgi:fermentation-respiration switch protein FrsA (DUF1100 family)
MVSSFRWRFGCVLVVMLASLSGCSHYSTLAPLERKLIFRPAPYPQGNWEPGGTVFEDAWFAAADGTRLHGWFASCDRPRAVVLFAHGNAGNITSRGMSVEMLRRRHRVTVMAFDYRGFGRSEGKPTEEGILQDARAARKWLAKRTGVAERDIIIMGRSLGGAVAVDLAAKDGARGLVLASTFTSLPDASAHHFPYLAPKLLMHHRLDSLAKIVDYHGPLLQSHGDADRVIPYELGRRLFAAAGVRSSSSRSPAVTTTIHRARSIAWRSTGSSRS